MKLQGDISKAAQAVAEDFQLLTTWQKYIVFNTVIHLAVIHRHKHVTHLPAEETIRAYHNVTAEYYNSDEANEFRGKHKCKTGADFLRKSMLHGCSIIGAFKNNTLPNSITRDAIYDDVAKFIGSNAKLAYGLKRLRQIADGHVHATQGNIEPAQNDAPEQPKSSKDSDEGTNSSASSA